MSYTGISNQKDITIEKIFSVHYFEYASNFSFEGESHDFWEFIYVDKGVVELTAGNEVIHLHANEIFFHEPVHIMLIIIRKNITDAKKVIFLIFILHSKAHNDLGA